MDPGQFSSIDLKWIELIIFQLFRVWSCLEGPLLLEANQYTDIQLYIHISGKLMVGALSTEPGWERAADANPAPLDIPMSSEGAEGGGMVSSTM